MDFDFNYPQTEQSEQPTMKNNKIAKKPMEQQSMISSNGSAFTESVKVLKNKVKKQERSKKRNKGSNKSRGKDKQVVSAKKNEKLLQRTP